VGLVPLTAGALLRRPESSHQNCAQTGFSAQPEGVASEPVQRGSSPLAGHNDGSGQGPPSSSGRLELLAAFGLPGLGPGGPGSGVWAASAPPGWFGRARHAVGPDTTKPRIASRRPGQPAGLAGGRSSGDRAAWSATAWRCPSGRGVKHSLVVARTTRVRLWLLIVRWWPGPSRSSGWPCPRPRICWPGCSGWRRRPEPSWRSTGPA
jgi:hypothetical protein